MNKFKLLPVLVTMLMMFSCYDELQQAHFIPTEGSYGTRIKVFSHGQDSLSANMSIYFNGVDDFWLVDSIRHDTIYFTIPFGVESGDIVINNWPDSIILHNFQVGELRFDSIRIRWSDLNYTINSHKATYTRVEYNSLTWDAEIREDTVEITGDYQTGDVRYEYHLLLKDLGNDTLPEFIDAYTILFNDYGGPGSVVNFPMTNGLVYIQDWKPGQMISGRVLSLPWWKNSYIFYCDFSE